MERGTILNLQFLRAVAAGLVALFHLQPMLRTRYGTSVSLEAGAVGVDIFFVISGFVMVYSNRRMDRSIAAFLVARLFRIVPLYWLATLAVVAFYQAGFHPNGLVYFEPYMLLQSLFFVTTLFPDGRHDLVLSLGWTLIYELFFYLVFALSFRLGTPQRVLLMVGLVFVALILLGIAMPGLPHRIAYFTSPILLEFLFGGALALLLMRWQACASTVPAWATPMALGGIALGGALALLPDFLGAPPPGAGRALMWGVPATMIVGGFIVLETRGWVVRSDRALLLGAASYMLYLFHPLTMQGSVKIVGALVPVEGQAGALLASLCALAVTIVVACLVHLFVERRILAIGRRVAARIGARRLREAVC